MLFIKYTLRSLQEHAERRLLGGVLQALLWRYRHVYKRGWAESYLDTLDHPHRPQLVDAVATFDPVMSVLEIGCASGANLICLRTRLPRANLIGLDINPKAIKVAKQKFLQIRDHNIRLFVGRAHDLTAIPDKSIDVVVSDAVLMFITPDRIRVVVSEMMRVASKGIVMNEYHSDGEKNGRFCGGRWIYDLVNIIRILKPGVAVYKRKSTFTGGAWDNYGTLIEIHLQAQQ